MLRNRIRHIIGRITQSCIVVLACNTLLASFAYDQPSPETVDNDVVESAATTENSATALTPAQQAEAEFRTALAAELDRRGLTSNSVVCDTVSRRGSRIRKRECMSIAEWVEKHLKAQNEIYKLQANRAPRAWDTGQ